MSFPKVFFSYAVACLSILLMGSSAVQNFFYFDVVSL